MADPDDDQDRSPDESDDERPAEFDPDGRSGGDAGPDGTDESPGSDGTDGEAPDGTDGDREAPDGDRVGVTVEDGTDESGPEETFGGGAQPGEDPYDADPDAGAGDYGPGPEDRRAGSDRTWTDEDGVRSELDRLWEELEGLEDHVEGRTVSKESFEAEMKRYVRWRLRKGHVTGWGPYVVLLYGTGMTLGAFYYLEGLWAILAMVVVWLSTLGLYVVMVILGIGIGGVRFAWKYLEKARSLRSNV